MKAIMTKHFKVPTSMCDRIGKLSIHGIFTIFMDLACEHAPLIDLGADKLAKKDLFWVAARTKVKIHSRPEMLKEIEAVTWPEEPGRIRCNRYYTVSKNGNILVEGKTEWAIINLSTGKPTKLSEVYPDNLEHCEETVCNSPFARINDDFTDCEKIGKYKVCSNDIDIGQHMNNVAYIKALFSMFSCKELEEMNITDIDIAFRLQCYEGDTLTICKRNAENATEFGFINKDGKTAAAVRLESNN